MKSMKNYNMFAMMALMFASTANLFGNPKGIKSSSLRSNKTRSSGPIDKRTYESRMPLEAGNGSKLFSFKTKFGIASIHADNSNSAAKHLRKLIGERFGFRTSIVSY